MNNKIIWNVVVATSNVPRCPVSPSAAGKSRGEICCGVSATRVCVCEAQRDESGIHTHSQKRHDRLMKIYDLFAML